MNNYYGNNNIIKVFNFFFFFFEGEHKKALRSATKILTVLQSQLNQKHLQVPFPLSAFSNIQEYLRESCVTWLRSWASDSSLTGVWGTQVQFLCANLLCVSHWGFPDNHHLSLAETSWLFSAPLLHMHRPWNKGLIWLCVLLSGCVWLCPRHLLR